MKTGQDVFDDLFEIVLGARAHEWNNSEQLEELFAEYAEQHSLTFADQEE